MAEQDLLVPIRRDMVLREVRDAARGTAFHAHCQLLFYGLVPLTAATLLAYPALVWGAYLLGSWGWALGTAVSGGLALYKAVDHVALLGNARLRARLASRLNPPMEAIFVGLCRPENNTVREKYFTNRVETNDNVGFLEIGAEALVIKTEDGRIELPRASIRQVELERYVEYPSLRWIRIEVQEPGSAPKAILLSSREATTLNEERKATEALRAKLVEWFAEPLLLEGGAVTEP
jgi:hypothetical protein